MTKRNAALDALTAGKPAPEPTPPVKLAEQPKNVVSLTPAKAPKTGKVMLYLHPKVARKFKEIAFAEDCKPHDVYLRALDQFLREQGHGGIKGVIAR